MIRKKNSHIGFHKHPLYCPKFYLQPDLACMNNFLAFAVIALKRAWLSLEMSTGTRQVSGGQVRLVDVPSPLKHHAFALNQQLRIHVKVSSHNQTT